MGCIIKKNEKITDETASVCYNLNESTSLALKIKNVQLNY